MIKLAKLLGLFLMVSIFLPSCNSKVETLIVSSELAECTSAAPMKCFQVKRSSSEEWELFYSPIKGFDYEEGYEYTIQVVKQKIPDPPADSPNVEYKLIKVLRKEQKGISYTRLYGTPWRVISFQTSNSKKEVPENIEITMAFNSEGKVNGNAGCNKYFGGYTIKNQQISFTGFGSTKMMCPEEVMVFEDLFFKTIQQMTSLTLTEKKLIFKDTKGQKVELIPFNLE